eukprot:TRINITY_DN24433_c2_g1_i2.p1 TRINITY_DN24433_c2_g1~~TRINITY_DN24433_c2_g1_i2.p1  ORF type:complete len:130 (+),score=14.87 TRINITY_DN24433_c2_g1_i2:59-448(+)
MAALNRSTTMKSDEPRGGVWRFPTYYEGGGYDTKCPIQSAIVQCFREMRPPRVVPRDEVVAGVGVRDVAKRRQRRKAEGSAAERHSTAPPGHSVQQGSTTALAAKVLKPPPGPKPTTMRPRSTSRVGRQ